jgi:hypothetical protein
VDPDSFYADTSPVSGSLDHKNGGHDAIFCLIEGGIFFPLFLSNEPGTGFYTKSDKNKNLPVILNSTFSQGEVTWKHFFQTTA